MNGSFGTGLDVGTLALIALSTESAIFLFVLFFAPKDR